MDFAPDVEARLRVYEALLRKWQKAINLVAPSTVDEAWTRHIVDSAQISDLIGCDVRVYADLGCGGGFPGLVVALMRLELQVHLVESDARKCEFMRTVIRECSAVNAQVHNVRIEEAHGLFTPDVISARALAPLVKLITLCQPWRAENPALEMVFMKGARVEVEIAEAAEQFDFTYDRVQSLTDNAGCILRMTCQS